MSHVRYSRVPLNDLDFSGGSLRTLADKSYFNYDPHRGKYKSAFTYHGTFDKVSDDETDMAVVSSIPASKFCRCIELFTTLVGYLLVILTMPISGCFAIKNVKSYERLVVYRLGRLLNVMGPGYVFIIPCFDKWTKVDTRVKAFSVPPQKIITADGATIEIGADVYFCIKDAVMSVCRVQDLNHSTRILCQTLLQRHLSKQRLAEIQEEKLTIINGLMLDADQMTRTWGVEVQKIELSEVKVYSQPNGMDGSNPLNVLRSEVKVYSQPNGMDGSNPLNVLSQILFPPGNSNAPVKQLQNFYGASVQNFADAARGQVNPGRPRVSVFDLLSTVKSHLNSSLVRDFGCVYKFIIRDEQTEPIMFYLDLKNGEGSADTGEPPCGFSDVTIELSPGVLDDLLQERVSAFNAYMEGLLVVSGDLRSAMRLGTLIDTINQKK